MPNTSKNVDFIDNDEQGQINDSQAVKDHQVKDVLHKLFVIEQALKHWSDNKKEQTTKPKVSVKPKGALDGV
ncbi:hypothetical protein P9477_23230 [Enterobacter mori]|uniref:hypothetical protein n=1 Tax=Enterobacter mori TaxID=539813 RepID=UPI00398B6E7D